MASGIPLILLVGLFTTGVGLDIALAVSFAIVGVGLVFMIKAMRAESKIGHQPPTR
jgi:hypothetical protein